MQNYITLNLKRMKLCNFDLDIIKLVEIDKKIS